MLVQVSIAYCLCTWPTRPYIASGILSKGAAICYFKGLLIIKVLYATQAALYLDQHRKVSLHLILKRCNIVGFINSYYSSHAKPLVTLCATGIYSLHLTSQGIDRSDLLFYWLMFIMAHKALHLTSKAHCRIKRHLYYTKGIYFSC